MSILIRGLTMPKTCDDCPLQHSDELVCKITGNQEWEWADDHSSKTIHPRPADCPLIEINFDALEKRKEEKNGKA